MGCHARCSGLTLRRVALRSGAVCGAGQRRVRMCRLDLYLPSPPKNMPSSPRWGESQTSRCRYTRRSAWAGTAITASVTVSPCPESNWEVAARTSIKHLNHQTSKLLHKRHQAGKNCLSPPHLPRLPRPPRLRNPCLQACIDLLIGSVRPVP